MLCIQSKQFILKGCKFICSKECSHNCSEFVLRAKKQPSVKALEVLYDLGYITSQHLELGVDMLNVEEIGRGKDHSDYDEGKIVMLR